MCENHRRKLHAHANVHTIRLGRNSKIFAHRLHPFAAAAPYGNDAVPALLRPICKMDLISSIHHFNLAYNSVKIEVHLALKLIIQLLQNNIINIRSKVAHRCFQKIQLILHTCFLKSSPCR